MSRTYNRVYSRGYRAGRRTTKWEKVKWLLTHTRTDVEDWLTDERSDTDFFVILFAVVELGLACITMAVVAKG